MTAPVRNVRDLLEAHHGTRFTPFANRAAATVGVAVIQVLRQDPSRIGFLFVNLSLNTIFISPIGVPSAANGIRIGPNGGSLTMHWEDDGEVVAWEWRGVADGAASAFFALETVIVSGR